MYSTSKDIIDNVKLGADYSSVKKVYSVSIIYFDIEQHKKGAEPVDYVYYGRTEFAGLRNKKAVKTAKNMLKGGLAPKDVASFLEMPLKQVLQIKKEL